MLIVVGFKMLGSHYVDIPTEWMLATVLFILLSSVVASLVKPKAQATG
jgi:hypothetical protein